MIHLFRMMICLIFVFVFGLKAILAQTPGFFKDIFSDGGAHLTSSTNLEAAENLGLLVEYLYTADSSVQNEVMVSNDFDSNGHLLYPDGAPRFRLIYTNGGTAGNHGESLGETGRNRVRAFYNEGGSYTGSCAGAFIASLHYQETGSHPYYYHIWPGRTIPTGLLDSYTGHFIPESSALLNYFDFGGDYYIDNVRHNGGCFANEDIDYPPRSEVLLRYDFPSMDMHEQASTWAYKPGHEQGRIVVTGSHPESGDGGEILNLMQAILLYALDGTGAPRIKGELISGESRSMDLYTEDNLPEFTRIGDKQYHHFTISVPPEADSLRIELNAEAGFEFNLYADPNDFAFENTALYMSSAEGSEHVLSLPTETAGLWYIGVECASSVESFNFLYWGQTEVLNGVAYGITASWDTVGVVGIADFATPTSGFTLYPNFPNPFNPTTTITYTLSESSETSLVIYDINGRQIKSLLSDYQKPGTYKMMWNGVDDSGNPVLSGMYFARLQAGDFDQTIKMIYLQ
ncbi:T9SS type A sorting domain-containing protein [bacterium]|nr:T9SS type A sorting domain-containing protein [bacterium]